MPALLHLLTLMPIRDRGAMGNIVQLSPGETGSGGLDSAHGVLHKLEPFDMAKLTGMEHEYRCPLPSFTPLPCPQYASVSHG